MGLYGPGLDINKSDSEMLSSVYAPVPPSSDSISSNKTENEEDTEWPEDMPEDAKEQDMVESVDNEISDLKLPDKPKKGSPLGGLSRAELRKMQEEIQWQEGDIEHPNQMDLRVGKLIEVLQHDSDDMVFISEVDLGSYDESRLVATTLKESYKMEDLMNKLVVIVCNVIPLDDREIKSKTGKLLLATKTKFNDKGEEIGEYVELFEPWVNAIPGSRVYVDGFPLTDPFPNKDEEYFDFVMKDFLIDSNSQVVWRGLPLKIEGCNMTLSVPTFKDTYCKID